MSPSHLNPVKAVAGLQFEFLGFCFPGLFHYKPSFRNIAIHSFGLATPLSLICLNFEADKMHTFIKLLSAVLLVLSLTAWGVDASPRHKTKFNKHYRTGPLVLGGSTFKINQHFNPNYKRTANSGPVELAKTYKKFNVLFPDQVANAIAGIVGRLQGTDNVTVPFNASDVNFG